MPDLILDTSGDTLLLALFTKSSLLAEKHISHENDLSSLLLPSLNELLQESSLTLKDLEALFIGIGPGSYTGTRIGVATATSLSLALSIPLYPFCSLLAFLPPLSSGPFDLLLQAKHTNYLLSASAKNGHLESAFPGKTTDSSPKNALLPQKKPNTPSLLPYLSSLKNSPPKPPLIIYLHNF